jgi:hypothetical protein
MALCASDGCNLSAAAQKRSRSSRSTRRRKNKIDMAKLDWQETSFTMSFATLVADNEWDAIHCLLDEGGIHGVDPEPFDQVLDRGPVSLIRRLVAL